GAGAQQVLAGGPAGLEQPVAGLADAERGAADGGRERIVRRGADAGGVTGGEVHADTFGDGPDQVGVFHVADRGGLGLVEALPGVGGDRGERVVAGAVQDGDVGVQQPLQPEVAVVAAVPADHELAGAGRHVVGRLDVELFLDVERVAAGV